MSKFVQAAGFANVLDGLEDLATGDASASYAVGTPVDYGRYLEEGTSKMQPYPWLEPATKEVVSNGASIFRSTDDLDEFIKTSALEIQRGATKRLESTGQRPYRQTGNLAGSVEVVELD